MKFKRHLLLFVAAALIVGCTSTAPEGDAKVTKILPCKSDTYGATYKYDVTFAAQNGLYEVEILTNRNYKIGDPLVLNQTNDLPKQTPEEEVQITGDTLTLIQ